LRPVTGTGTPQWNARDRGTAIPTSVQWYRLYRQLIFARPGGIRITLTGLEPSEPYQLEIWMYDSGSAGDRISDVNANGTYLMTVKTNNSTPPVTGLENYYTSANPFNTDANGAVVLEWWPNPATVELSGANNPYAIINAFRLSSINPPRKAANPVPAIGAVVPSTEPNLQWVPGFGATSHDVYLGTNIDNVNKRHQGQSFGRPGLTRPGT